MNLHKMAYNLGLGAGKLSKWIEKGNILGQGGYTPGDRGIYITRQDFMELREVLEHLNLCAREFYLHDTRDVGSVCGEIKVIDHE